MTRAMSLRPYQQRAITKARQAYAAGKRSILLVSPTGSGKTRIAAEIVRSHLSKDPGHRVLFIAHREELVIQARAALTACGADMSRVEIFTVQSLLGGKRPQATMLVIDESQHYSTGSPEWFAVAEDYRSALRIGLTATPERGDGSPMGDMFDCLIPVASIRELTDLGYLVPCDVIAPVDAGRELAADPVQAYQQHAAGKKAIVFVATVEEAQDLADRFVAAGIPAGCVHGETAPDVRKATLDALSAGTIRVVTNIFVCTEGLDVPSLEAVILARGCTCASTYLQICGRSLRPHPGKTRALLVDLRGVVHVHGLPDEDREYSLDGKPIRRSKSAAVRQCPTCGAAFAPAPVCPRCGYVFPPPKPSKVKERELLAATVGAVTPMREKRAFFEELCQLVRLRGWKPAAVGMQFKARFGHWPPWPIPGFTHRRVET